MALNTWTRQGGGSPQAMNPVYPLGAKTANVTVDLEGQRTYIAQLQGVPSSMGYTNAFLDRGAGRNRAAFYAYPSIPDLSTMEDTEAKRQRAIRCDKNEFVFAERYMSPTAIGSTRRRTMAGMGTTTGKATSPNRGSPVCRPVKSNLSLIPKPPGASEVEQRMKVRAMLDPMGFVPDVQSTADRDGNFTVQFDGLITPTNNSDLPIVEGDDIEAYIPLPSELEHGSGTEEQITGGRVLAWMRPVNRKARDMFAFSNFHAAMETIRAKLGATAGNALYRPAAGGGGGGTWLVQDFKEDWVQYWYQYLRGQAENSVFIDGLALDDADFAKRTLQKVCDRYLAMEFADFTRIQGELLCSLRDANCEHDRFIIGKALTTAPQGQSFDLVPRRQGF